MRHRLVPLLLATLLVGVLSALGTGAASADPAQRPARSADFVGEWGGHTRGLTITRDPAGGRLVGTEEIGSGCCDPVVDLTFALTDVRGTRGHASMLGEVLSVDLHDPTAYDAAHPAPQVGDTLRVWLRRNVLHERLSGTTCCDPDSRLPWVCGA